MSDTTWQLVREHFAGEPRGEITLKGVREPVLAYEVFGNLDAPFGRSTVRG